MKVTLNDKWLTFELDAPWEKTTVDWLWANYNGDYFFKNFFSKMLLDRERVKVTLEVKAEVEKRIGTHN